MLSPTSEVVSSRACESFSSNPEFSMSPSRSLSGPVDEDGDLSGAYVNELLECGLKEERFRIDRKKLEDMLQIQQHNTNAALETAEEFFQRVMIKTSTLISWPSKLKIGAKSKKDPHVKIVGNPEPVQLAKEMILEVLDTKKNRVTLKMDVSHSDHSYIIGKGGYKIQQVMEETGCHIHFPDSNRNGSAEKSNQVSIAGQAAGVELARSKIRDLLPLVFMFELPNGESVSPGEECSPAIQHIQQTYSFNVAFRCVGGPVAGRTLLVVRGCQRLLSRLRQGLSLLMEYLTGSKTIPVMGFMKTEIAAHHHQFVMGACGVNSQMIMNRTGATIHFPDSFGQQECSSSIQPASLIAGHGVLSKSTVIIQGSFDSVCLAWQDLLKCLPLVLMFDLKEGQELDPVMVNNFMEAFNINIMVRPKMKENTKSVFIRGAEKDCKVLFQVRKEILGLDDKSCFFPPDKSGSLSAPGIAKQVNPKDPMQKMASSQGMTTAESLSLLSNILQQNPQIVGLLSNLSTAFPAVGQPPEILPRSTHLQNALFRTAVHSNVQHVPMNHYTAKRDVENWINRPDGGYAIPNGASFQNSLQKDGNLLTDDNDSGIFLPSFRTKFQNGFETRSDMSSQTRSSASSTSSNETLEFETNSLKISQSNEQNLGAEIHQLLAEYGNKKLTANEAMQQPIGEGFRTPNQLWSGYGFSKSMPDFAGKRISQNSGSISELLDMENTKTNCVATSKTWNPDLMDKTESPPLKQAESPFSFSNFWENIPQQPAVNYGAIKSVEQLLNLLDLEKYTEVFNRHEIDLMTFISLMDIDLQQLRISYGARRKMLAAISAIRNHRFGENSLKNFRVAPGAERRSFLAKYSSGSPLRMPSPLHQEGNSARI